MRHNTYSGMGQNTYLVVKPPRPKGRGFCLVAALRVRGAGRSIEGNANRKGCYDREIGDAYDFMPWSLHLQTRRIRMA
jgi:hypothetical protein